MAIQYTQETKQADALSRSPRISPGTEHPRSIRPVRFLPLADDRLEFRSGVWCEAESRHWSGGWQRRPLPAGPNPSPSDRRADRRPFQCRCGGTEGSHTCWQGPVLLSDRFGALQGRLPALQYCWRGEAALRNGGRDYGRVLFWRNPGAAGDRSAIFQLLGDERLRLGRVEDHTSTFRAAAAADTHDAPQP